MGLLENHVPTGTNPLTTKKAKTLPVEKGGVKTTPDKIQSLLSDAKAIKVEYPAADLKAQALELHEVVGVLRNKGFTRAKTHSIAWFPEATACQDQRPQS